ncbi:MAG: polyketide synthase dehydratase domain-containing protein, partial [Bacteroidales bacterium]|nr:polyketide synthase dehydratase domain-containing protein [Bacteroidales bacterium]
MINIKAITMLSKVQKKLNNQSSDKQMAIMEAVRLPESVDALAAQILASTLRSLGLFSNGVSKFAHLSLDKRPAPFYERWLISCIQYLQEQKLLSHDLTLKHDLRVLDDLWFEWKTKKSEWEANANLKAQINLLDVCLKSLPVILSGKQPATDFMFPNSSMELVEGIYKGNVQADYLNGVLGETLKACIEERLQADKDCKIRLLEIGAGTGGTTAKLLPMLKVFGDTVAEYCYTDLSKAFLMHAEEYYQPQFPALTTAIFDVSKPLVSQSIAADKYDFIIATNVLHATPNIRETLRNSKAVLKNQGVLLINEMSTWTLFTHLTFGLLEGWWLYEDTALRLPGSPGLTPQKWKEVMEEVGFESVFFPAEKAHRFGHQVIAASSDGLVRQRFSKQAKITLDKKNVNPEILKPVKPIEVVKISDNVGESLRDKSISFFQELVAKTLKMNPQQIEPNQPLEKYGMDSILVVQLTNQFRKVFPDITSTLFFEERSIDGLVNYFIENKKEALMALLPITTTIDEPEQIPTVSESTILQEQKPLQEQKTSRILRESSQRYSQVVPSTSSSTPSIYDVAIIGLSGRYPQSNSLSEFWINLSKGINCITEIPKDRWNWEEYFDEEKGKLGKIYTKWGGFLNDIDKFDPLFFKIAPKDAKRMDPQERLFLESCYHAIEDAGYTPETLGNVEKIGVFAGVMNARYTSQPLHYSIANRVSYLFNFQGPSMAVDTACSSSLTAIHLALESIYSGLSDCAIAGGVNLILDPIHYLELTAMTMLSPGNQCKAFGDKADGFIDAEGVGAIVLKPLRQAEQDGDHIYGIIKGSAVNAGGKTNGYTVPNPKAQSTLITKALERANLVAEQISYIEAHGTGTALGDPIEVAALTRAFKETSNKKQFCAIGSLKSNIGHCESASGIAGLTKVLLQLKYEQLVPSIHADIANPEIDFSQTPFIHQKSLEKWQRPSREVNGVIQEIPRIAGISSFGAGGANAHIIVQEYLQPTEARRSVAAIAPNTKIMIPLSARTPEQLQQKVRDLFNFIRTSRSEEQAVAQKPIDLSALAYTLQVGREAMEERLGFMVNSVDQLAEKLQAYINGEQDIEDVYQGQVKRNKDTVSQFSADADLQETINKWIAQKKLSKLLDWWVKGLQLDWNKFYGEEKPLRISLPIYPFAKERHWVDMAARESIAATGKTTAVIHPLLHANTSDLQQQSYSSTFSGEEFFIKDYHVKIGGGLKVLPIVAYLEMARVAIEKAMPATQETRILELHNVVWGQPIAITESKQVTIALFAKDSDHIDYEVYSQDKEEEIIHCQGQVVFSQQSVPARLEIAQLKAQMQKGVLDPNNLYNNIFADLGINYGQTYQGVTAINKGENQLLAELRLPSSLENINDGYILHPSMMEGALQASFSLIVDLTKTSRPFALESTRIVSPCTKDMYAWVRYSRSHQVEDKITKLDIDLCDQEGNVCVQMRGISYQQESVSVREQVPDQVTSTVDQAKSSVATFVPRKISISTITSGKISFSTPQIQTFKKEELKKPTSISLVASNAFQSEKLEVRALGKSLVTLSNMTVEPSHHRSKSSTPSSVSLYDHGDGIFTI